MNDPVSKKPPTVRPLLPTYMMFCGTNTYRAEATRYWQDRSLLEVALRLVLQGQGEKKEGNEGVSGCPELSAERRASGRGLSCTREEDTRSPEEYCSWPTARQGVR